METEAQKTQVAKPGALDDLFKIAKTPAQKEEIRAWIQKWLYSCETEDSFRHGRFIMDETMESLARDSAKKKIANGIFEYNLINFRKEKHPGEIRYCVKYLGFKNGGEA